MSRSPRVFVSYSHDSASHKEWVLQLAKDLRASGIDSVLDLWDLRPGQDVVRFMEQGISQSDRVILVCSDGYLERANARLGGVGYEGLIITGELVANTYFSVGTLHSPIDSRRASGKSILWSLVRRAETAGERRS